MEKPVLIQGAMDIETTYLIEKLENKNKKIINGYEFYIGNLFKIPVVISITRVGTINSAISTILAINEFNPKYVINQGTAGGYVSDIHKGDIVLGEFVLNMNACKTNFHGIGEGIHPDEWNYITWNGDNGDTLVKIEANCELLNAVESFLKNIPNKKVVKGTIMSGDCWNNEIDRINCFVDKFNVICEEMESYGVYKVCSENDVPVLCVRIIANNITNGEEYDRNLAIEMQKEIIKFIIENNNRG